MAVIKIKTIKNNLQKVINYGKNGKKTENGILVSSVNCAVDTAYEEMALTKKFFQKEKGTLGYHFIESFKGYEVPPEKANLLGKQLAEELWGDKYQIVICTHTNKENVHNHIIMNSVSFIDGKKYHNGKEEIALVRQTSDRICWENYLSVVTTPNAEKSKEYWQKSIDNFNRKDEKMKIIINDIDEAIKSVKMYSDFKSVLKAKGYTEIKDGGKYLSMKTPYYSRNVRIDKVFGERYSVQGIKDRIYGYVKEERPPVANFNPKYYRKIYTGPKINKTLLKTSSLYRLYVHYLYALGKLPAKIQYQKLTPEYFKEKRKNNMLLEEVSFLARHIFNSIKEVKDCKSQLESKLPELKGEREILWRKYHKATSEYDKTTIKKEIDELTEKIDTINAQRNACNRIIDRYSTIVEEYKNEKEVKTKVKEMSNNKNRSR